MTRRTPSNWLTLIEVCPTGTYRQRTEKTKPQRDILAKLDLTPPKKIIELPPAPA